MKLEGQAARPSIDGACAYWQASSFAQVWLMRC